MEKEITYDIISVSDTEVGLVRTVEVTWPRVGRYGIYFRTTVEKTTIKINISRLNWLIKRAYEGVRVRVYPSDISAIKLLLDEGFEFEEDPWYLLWVEETGWEL